MRIYHGKIISLDNENTIYKYLIEDHGRIIHLGNSLPAKYSGIDNAHVLELGNRVLLPSFGDGHMHFPNWALIAVSYSVVFSDHGSGKSVKMQTLPGRWMFCQGT